MRSTSEIAAELADLFRASAIKRAAESMKLAIKDNKAFQKLVVQILEEEKEKSDGDNYQQRGSYKEGCD